MIRGRPRARRPTTTRSPSRRSERPTAAVLAAALVLPALVEAQAPSPSPLAPSLTPGAIEARGRRPLEGVPIDAAPAESERSRANMLATPLSLEVRAAATADEGKLTLATVLASVEAQHPTLLAALAERAQAEAQQLTAQGGFDPAVRASGSWDVTGPYSARYVEARVEQPTPFWGLSAFGGYRLGLGTYADYDAKRDTNDGGEVFGGLRVPIVRDGPIDARRANVRVGELAVAQADANVELARLELRRQATLRYYEWVAAGLRAEVIQAWLELAVMRDGAIAARVARGDVPEIERTENQRAILQRQGAAVAAEQALLEASLALSIFLRDAGGQTRVPRGGERPLRLPEPELQTGLVALETTAAERRPDLVALRAQCERLEVDLRLAENAGRPAVDLSAAAAKEFGAGPEKRAKPELTLGLSVDIPTLNRVAEGRAAVARAATTRVLELERLTRDRIVADARAASMRIDAAVRRAQVTRRELRVAHQLAEAELKRFELGESNLLLVNLREQASAEADIRNVDAMLDVQRALAEFQQVVAAR